jgi:ferredoxin/truncated hemoglobin YjbI
MAHLKYEKHEVCSREGESVLDALLRHGINVPFSCRSGSCHVCMQQCVQGTVPEKAQRSLKPEQREQGYFLPCRCVPETDMEIAPRPSRSHQTNKVEATPESPDYPPADPGLWAALREGEMLMAALQELYERVFNDPRLSSFFEGVTRQRAIEKQYLFLRQVLTGEKVYFGDRPRNAHHWMVISDELFDHRANLMLDCLRAQGLPEDMVQRFHQVEEFYRRDIVKAAPVAKMMGDIELPLDGFEELTMDVGTLCDSCEREVEPGEKVIYHVRIGKVYCSDCSARQGASSR